MSKTLVIAEKPSVAADLTRALGGKAARAEFFEVDDYIITSAVGHLVELCLPNKMTGGKGLSWKLDALPIIPEEFELQPIARSADRLKVVKKLLKDPGVTTVINACDAGREGELIFHNIIQLTGCKKPVKRLWLQSMTKEAIPYTRDPRRARGKDPRLRAEDLLRGSCRVLRRRGKLCRALVRRRLQEVGRGGCRRQEG